MKGGEGRGERKEDKRNCGCVAGGVKGRRGERRGQDRGGQYGLLFRKMTKGK